MSRKAKSAGVEDAVAAITIPAASLVELVKGPITAAEVQAASMALKKAMIERAMGAELSHHLGRLRADPDSEARTALHRLRRQDHRDVRAGHDGARDPRLPGGAVADFC